MSKFQTLTIKKYEKLGYYVVNLIKTNKNGITDLMCLKANEPTVFIECKERADTLKPLQKFRIDELNKIGCTAFCLQDGKGQIYP